MAVWASLQEDPHVSLMRETGGSFQASSGLAVTLEKAPLPPWPQERPSGVEQNLPEGSDGQDEEAQE